MERFFGWIQHFRRVETRYVPNIKDPLISLFDIDSFKEFFYAVENNFYFSKKSLEITLQKAGLSGEVRLYQEYPVHNHLHWIYINDHMQMDCAREVAPPARLKNEAFKDKWEAYWKDMNDGYKKLLIENGYSDRLFCIVRSNLNDR